jgi:hypothetical protein
MAGIAAAAVVLQTQLPQQPAVTVGAALQRFA